MDTVVPESKENIPLNPQEKDFDKYVGRRIEYQDHIGTVKYAGFLHHKDSQTRDPNQVWLGVQWDDASRGKHNGTVESYKYFTCDDGKNSGSLLKLDKGNLGNSLLEGIHLRYKRKQAEEQSQSVLVVNKHGDTVQYSEEAYFETSKKFRKMVEFIGFDLIWKKLYDLQNIQVLSLSHCHISDLGKPGFLKTLLPKIRNLSLELNLLYDWNQVFMIGNELTELEELSLGHNRLKELEESVAKLESIKVNHNNTTFEKSPLKVFPHLKVIVLISMDLTWKALDKVLPIFANVQELILGSNRLTDFENLTMVGSDFPNLEVLDLADNNIVEFKGILKFKDAPVLRSLVLNKNSLSNLGVITGFGSVKSIGIKENNITEFFTFAQLAQFPLLENLRVTKNPICLTENPLKTSERIQQIRRRAIAEIKNLKILNGGELKRYERKDCELYYLRNAFHEFFANTGQKGDHYEFDQLLSYCKEFYPRVPELIKIYGNPYEEGVQGLVKKEVVRPKIGVLIKLQLQAFTGPKMGNDPTIAKYTDNTLIVNMKDMLVRQFSIPANQQKIYLKHETEETFILMDENLKDLRFYGVKEGSEIFVGDTEL